MGLPSVRHITGMAWLGRLRRVPEAYGDATFTWKRGSAKHSVEGDFALLWNTRFFSISVAKIPRPNEKFWTFDYISYVLACFLAADFAPPPLRASGISLITNQRVEIRSRYGLDANRKPWLIVDRGRWLCSVVPPNDRSWRPHCK